jgi:hypothetical protein
VSDSLVFCVLDKHDSHQKLAYQMVPWLSWVVCRCSSSVFERDTLIGDSDSQVECCPAALLVKVIHPF